PELGAPPTRAGPGVGGPRPARARDRARHDTVIRAELRPKGPYSLRVSGRLGSDATRVVGDGTYTATIDVGGALEIVHARQRVDGAICVRAESEEGVEHVRFVLGLDDDHSEFLRRFANDPMLGESTRRLRG